MNFKLDGIDYCHVSDAMMFSNIGNIESTGTIDDYTVNIQNTPMSERNRRFGLHYVESTPLSKWVEMEPYYTDREDINIEFSFIWHIEAVNISDVGYRHQTFRQMC